MLFWGWVCTNGCIQRQTTAHTTPHHTTQTKPTMRSTKGDGGVLGTPLLLNIIGPLQRVISGGELEHRPFDHINGCWRVFGARIHPLCDRPSVQVRRSPIVLSNRSICHCQPYSATVIDVIILSAAPRPSDSTESSSLLTPSLTAQNEPSHS